MTTETTTETNDATAAADEAVADTALGAVAAATETDAGEADKADGEVADTGETGETVTVEGAPEAYDTTAFKLPEGAEFDAEGFEAVEPVLKDLNLSQDQAGKLMETYAGKIVPMIEGRVVKAQEDMAAQLRADLARDLQADPEVGGKLLDESKAHAAKAIAHFIPKGEERSDFSTFLNESGLGNHPLLMRVIAGAGRVLSEASTPSAETASQPLTESEKFYGKRG